MRIGIYLTILTKALFTYGINDSKKLACVIFDSSINPEPTSNTFKRKTCIP